MLQKGIHAVITYLFYSGINMSICHEYIFYFCRVRKRSYYD